MNSDPHKDNVSFLNNLIFVIIITGVIATVLGLHLLNNREMLLPNALFCQVPGYLVNLDQISTPLVLSVATAERLVAVVFPIRLIIYNAYITHNFLASQLNKIKCALFHTIDLPYVIPTSNLSQ